MSRIHLSRIHMSRIPGWTKVSKAVGWALAHQIQSLSLTLSLPLRFALRLPLRFALRFVLFAGVAVCALFAGPAWAGVIYVKADATGAKTGLSWADAYTDLQAALAAVEWGDEIWVAQGTYKPTSGTDRAVSFVLEAGVGLYGGFAGAETERGQRNWETNATILSGDIGTTGSATDNSYRVVTGAYLTALDGFTITGGNANGSESFSQGGGMSNKDCSPTVTNCTFSGNTARGDYNYSYGGGGGMCNENCSPTVTNCTFSGNTAGVVRGHGGGMCNYGGSPTVTNCTFTGNTASGGGNGEGGGMYNKDCSPTVTNSTFSGNSASSGDGGGMYNASGSATVTNCTFSDNTATYGGGGGMYNASGSATVTKCTFSDNTATYGAYYGGGDGGGMYGGSATVTSCTFSGNTADNGGGVSGGQTFTNCTFSGNTADNGGGVSGGQTFTNCTFSDNTATYGGGGKSGGGTVANCIFWDNTAPLGAEVLGGTFSHCDIRGSGGSGALWNPALGKDGGGNIMSDPRFVAPAAPSGPDGLWRTTDDGLRLQSDSPCIGAADPAVAPGTDILGLARGTAPDIGAYEFFSMPPAKANPVWLLFR